MKKRYILFEFLLIFIFLVLPPVFATSGAGLSKTGTFSPFVLMQLAIAVLLQWQFMVHFKGTTDSEKPFAFKIAFWGTITLGCLMLIFAAMQTLALFIERENLSKNLLPAIGSTSGWIFLVLAVITAAFYEEVIYRQDLPELLYMMLGPKTEKKWVSRLMEFALIGIFAISHRYLGWIPVLNAFASGSILRFCYRKTGSVWAGTAAHFIYNMTLIAFSILSRPS